MAPEQAEHLGEVTAKVATYGGAATGFLFGMTDGEFAAVSAALIGAIGLAFQIWLGVRRDKRESAVANMRMRQGRPDKDNIA